jgi:hypothetical protein
VEVLGGTPQLPLGLSHEVDEHGYRAHEEKAEPAEATGDQEGDLPGLEILTPGLPPSEPDGRPATNDQYDPDIEGRARRSLIHGP